MKEYPEDGPIPVPFQTVNETEGMAAKGSSYTSQTWDGHIETGNMPFPTSASMDTDNVEMSQTQRKLLAIQKLKQGAPFVKYPAGSRPLDTSYTPETFAKAWPTLFPYGIGSFEDPLRTLKPFKTLPLRKHVRHLLSLSDRRFQTHTSFIFVMMNILQRKTSSFQSRLATRRAWFPKVQECLAKVNEVEFREYIDRIKQQDGYAAPENTTEHAVSELMRYSRYMSGKISGSTSELTEYREEIRALTRVHGTPHFFMTLNPADAHNPLSAFLAGEEIDIDKRFDEIHEKHERTARSTAAAKNPVAAARFFHTMMNQFLNTVLGCGRENKTGILGKVKDYYGVVENQGRGSLHLHILIWVEGGLSPTHLREKAAKNGDWRKRFLAWLEDLIKTDLPPGTLPKTEFHWSDPAEPVMSRPLDPKSPTYGEEYLQDVRNVLECTAQIHSHSPTCFKHLKYQPKPADWDSQCRFELPESLVAHSHFDDEGHLYLRRHNGFMNKYHELVVSLLRCNMDVKFIGSGTAALAMVYYVTNYITKTAVDSAVAFSAFAASVKGT